MSYYHMEIECSRCKNKIQVEISPPLPEIGKIKTGRCFSDKCKDITDPVEHILITLFSG